MAYSYLVSNSSLSLDGRLRWSWYNRLPIVLRRDLRVSVECLN